MSDFDHDAAMRGRGLFFAVLSAVAFGTSGTLGRGLLESGWSPTVIVTLRLAIAAIALTIPAVVVLRRAIPAGHRREAMAASAPTLLLSGIIAYAGCQLAYFNAVTTLPVSTALLIEYLAPIGVIAWLWARHRQRPSAITGAGALLCAAGLLLVLRVFDSSASLPVGGVLWALGAMACLVVYFFVATASALPPLVVACSALWIGAATLLVVDVSGLMPTTASTADAHYQSVSVPFWLPILGLALIAGAFAYWTGTVAIRMLGPRVASFVALLEVIAAVGFSWLLVDESPTPMQLLGALVVLVGVATVQAGETPAPSSEANGLTPSGLAPMTSGPSAEGDEHPIELRGEQLPILAEPLDFGVPGERDRIAESVNPVG